MKDSIVTLDRIKGSIRSLTIWINGILLALIPLYETFKNDFVQLQPYMTDANYRKLAVLIIIGNVILRFRTTKDLADK